MKFRKGSLVQAWLSLKENEETGLRENGSTSDFPNILANVQYKMLIKAFYGMPSPWRTYCKLTTAMDFKPNNRTWLGEMQDLQFKQPGGPYKARTLKDYNYSIQLGTYGSTFQLLRETVINDDLNAFQEIPTKMGRAAIRTQSKAIANLLESNPNAYDGSPIFRAANISHTALTADVTGISALQAGIKAIATATDPGTSEILGIQAKYLVVSPTLAEIAKWLLHATMLVGSTSSLANNALLTPALTSGLELLIDPYLTAFPNRWYLLADPAQLHAVEVMHLEGQTEPALLMKDPDTRVVAGGGEDPWGYYYDDIEYKVRYDWAIAAAFYQAVFGGNQ
jgi:phage major head subunit gpT-like protein